MQMNLAEVELPSNRKFGFFFTAVFLGFSTYFYHKGSDAWLYAFSALTIAFLIATVVKADVLHPLNKLWMRFGLLLGMIVSPIVLGVIFFGLFTPIAIVMRIAGRDELRLRLKKQSSHWIKRETEAQSQSFKHQF
ncbi:MAG TPA: hypothetical protein EYF95_03140 [Flavobacteriales bacterium]|nr:hypothetical protein [Flavobacteriales bacterium]